MDDFIKEIFKMDNDAKSYAKELEEKKEKLLSDRNSEVKKIKDSFTKYMEEEKDNLNLKLKEAETNEEKLLSNYKEKAIETKKLFAQKEEDILNLVVNSILEKGE